MIKKFYILVYKAIGVLKVYVLTRENYKKIFYGIFALLLLGVTLYGGRAAYDVYRDIKVIHDRDLEIDKYNKEMQKMGKLFSSRRYSI